jgi:precorrin-6B methylase 2
MSDDWNGEALLALARTYQPACILLAAAEIGLFEALAAGPMEADQLASELAADLRGTTVLADALVALGLLQKNGAAYASVPEPAEVAAALPMLRHQGNCMRRWARTATAAKEGRPVERGPSLRGESADQATFIEAMASYNRDAVRTVVAGLGPLAFDRLLDVGGGPGTWTIGFLETDESARATLFDLPHVLTIARRHLEDAGMVERVELVGGDFCIEPLPGGADLAWVSAILHQFSRSQCRDLLRNVHGALVDGGQILIRDIVMDDSHTRPQYGALFAVNMLVSTEGGGTFSLAELTEDLDATGFGDVTVVEAERPMDQVVRATKRC